jgi:hypothetical protein
MDFWGMPLTLLDLVLTGTLFVAPGLDDGLHSLEMRRPKVESRSPAPQSDVCRLVPGRWGAPSRYDCSASQRKDAADVDAATTDVK